MRSDIRTEKSVHRNQPVLKLIFPYNESLIELVRSLPGALWSRTMRCWYIPDNPRSTEALYNLPGVNIIADDGSANVEIRNIEIPGREIKKLRIIRYSGDRMRLAGMIDDEILSIVKAIPLYHYHAETNWLTIPHTEEALELLTRFCRDTGRQMEYDDEWAEQRLQPRKTGAGYQDIVCPSGFEEKLRIQRYSEHTISNYCSAIKEFTWFYRDRSPDTLHLADIEKYLLYLAEERKVSLSYHNISLSAIKFYYEKVLDRNMVTGKLERPRREKLLPVVLSEAEVGLLFDVIDNLKHKCILMMVYSGGLRLSEVVNLRVRDIDSKRMMIYIKGAKGRKDRYTVLSKQILNWLRLYYKTEKPRKWLFEGALGGQYSMQSVQKLMRNAVRAAGIRKHATVHTLRHSFATHMLENGTDLRYIQSLLGHSSTRTTEIYTHITTRGLEQLTSPFDRLKLKSETTSES